ncbi:MAG: PilZ domain-containing protein [Candidatus Omnitrophica bacterium]|nr:PilZ domain-containing protein [Candidatus Omnitrophota bacterium]MCM8831893.1 PilZ domain-containing protein [Candidatus Omnitrophota bacterium]
MSWEGVEKRRFVRANYPCRIVIYTPKEHTIFTHTENVGAGGIRVIIEEKLNIGEIVGLELYLFEEKEPIPCKGRVVWVVEKESRYRKNLFFFDTGFEFSQISDVDRETIKRLVEAIIFEKK